MRGTIRRALGTIAVLAAVSVAPAADQVGDWTVKSALKKADKATKKMRFLTAGVDWVESFNNIEVEGTGKVWVDLEGRLRGEVKGDNPRTVLIVTPAIQLYRHLENKVDVYNTLYNRDIILKFVMLGFQPRGSDLRVQYDVQLSREEAVGEHQTLLFTLSPKSKELTRSIQGIMLWLDTTTWLPVQLVIRRTDGGQQVTVRYRDMAEQEALPPETFKADWPETAEIVTER